MHELRKPMLQKEYDLAKSSRDEKISQVLCLGLMSDGWTNVNGEGVVNFIVGTPEPVFHFALSPKDGKEDSDFYSNNMIKVMKETDFNKYLLIVADNAKVMKSTFVKVRKQFPHIFNVGCAAHVLNLLAKDLLKLEFLKKISKAAVEVVKIKRKCNVLAEFRIHQESHYGENAVSLKLPNPTRFAGAALLLHSLQSNKAALKQTEISENRTWLCLRRSQLTLLKRILEECVKFTGLVKTYHQRNHCA